MDDKIKLKTVEDGFVDMEKFIDGLHEWIAKEIYGPLLKRIKTLEEENKTLRDRLARLEGQLDATKGKAEFEALLAETQLKRGAR